MILGDTASSAGIWAPVVGIVSAAFITTAGTVIVGRARSAARDSQNSATNAAEDSNSISTEKQLIKTLEVSLADMRERLVVVEVREERCQQRLEHLERRDEESTEALRDASILQKALQHEIVDLQEQVAALNGIIERRKLKREA